MDNYPKTNPNTIEREAIADLSKTDGGDAFTVQQAYSFYYNYNRTADKTQRFAALKAKVEHEIFRENIDTLLEAAKMLQ